MLDLEKIHPSVADKIRATISDLKMTEEERTAFLSFRIPDDDPHLKHLRGLDATSYMIQNVATLLRAAHETITERNLMSQAAHLESDLEEMFL